MKILVQIDSLFKDLIPDFLKNRELELVTFKEWISEKNWEELKKALHRFKGTAGSYGFLALSEKAATLEKLVQQAPTLPESDLQKGLKELQITLESLEIEYTDSPPSESP